jgi:thioredoxin reductase
VIETGVAIIGAGPAGLTAAIQLQRYRVPFVLFEKNRLGGLLWNANMVENYPGFPSGISGPALVKLMQDQLRRMKVTVTRDEVLRIDLSTGGLRLRARRATYRARHVIIASGTRARDWPIPVSSRLHARVFSDIVPLLEVRGRQVAIIGAGDAAFDHALNLASKRNSVTILNHGQRIQSLGLLRRRAAGNPRIAYRAGTSVRRVAANRATGGLMLKCETRSGVHDLAVDFLVFAVGRDPEQGFLSASVLVRRKELQRDHVLFFAGDVRNGSLRQTAIATGDGLRAAMHVVAAEQGST